MLIVSAGRSRSGSTLMYNIIRLTLYSALGSSNVYSTIYKSYNRNDIRDHHVVKIHGHDNYLYDNADCIFSSERNKSQQRLSILNHQRLQIGKELTDGELNRIVKHDYNRYLKWKGHKNFKCTFEFEQIINDKEFVIKNICNILGLTVLGDIQSVIDDLSILRLPSSGVDPVTGLTSHHITSERYKVKL